MNHPHAQQIHISPDNAINLLACVWRLAFDDATHDPHARQDIIDFFGIGTIRTLYERGLIAWDPLTVPLQTELWEV